MAIRRDHLRLCLPTIDGKVNFPGDTGGSRHPRHARATLLSHLKMTFMGTLDAHNGRGACSPTSSTSTSAESKSQTRDFSLGDMQASRPATTADLNLDLKGFVWTMAGEYRLVSDPRVDRGRCSPARGCWSVKPTLGLVDHRRPRPDRPSRAAAEARRSATTSGTASSGSRVATHSSDDRQLVRSVLPRRRHRTDTTHVAGRRRRRLFVPLGRCHRHVAVSGLERQVGEADRGPELQRPDDRRDIPLVSA